MLEVQRVAAAGEVHVEALVVLHQAVVRRVVQAAIGQRGPHLVALRRVVVDDVEDHLDAVAVQLAHHALELAQALRRVLRGAVARLRRHEVDRVVAPVVHQPQLGEAVRIDVGLHRQQLDRRHAQPLEVVDRAGLGEALVGAAQVLRHLRLGHREALDVRLVDHGLVPGPARRRVVFPVERVVDDDALRHAGGAVVLVWRQVVRVFAHRVVEQRVLPVRLTGQGARVRVDEQLRRVEAQPFLRVVRTVGAQAVELACLQPRHEAVPDVAHLLSQRHLLRLRPVRRVEEAELDAIRALGVDGEVHALVRHRGAQGVRLAGKDTFCGFGHPDQANAFFPRFGRQCD